MEIFNLSLAGPVKTQVKLMAKDPEEHYGFGTLWYEATRGEDEYSIAYSFDARSGKIHFDLTHPPTMTANCILVCGISLAGPIMDCYVKHKTSWYDFKECLKNQGHALSTAALACIIGCMAS